MTKDTLPRPARKPAVLNKPLTFTARALFALCMIHSSVAVVSNAQARTDNRRIFWTGSSGMAWDNNATASWMASGSFLAYAATGAGSDVWLDTNPLTGDPIAASPTASFVGGDTVIFDSYTDVADTYWTGNSWRYPEERQNDIYGTRTIVIATGGVNVSDVVVSGPGNFVFIGGAITADTSFVQPGSVLLTGTGVGAAANRSTGSLVKIGSGMLTLSNTAANHFSGGVHLLEGVLSITDNRALGGNSIITNYLTAAGGGNGTYGYDYFLGENLLNLVMRPSGTSTAYAISHNASSTSYTGFNITPAVVLGSGGELLRNGSAMSPVLHVAPEAAGLEITGDIYIGNRVLTLNIEGETTISGRIVGGSDQYGANSGSIIKDGAGTLIITGTQNWFYGASKFYNELNAGRVVITHPHALGVGATSVNPAAVLEFRGVVGTMRQAFVGGGEIQITNQSDVTFNWRNGTLDGFDGMSGNGSWHPGSNDIGRLAVSGQSRFSAIASGTYSTVLGGAMVYVTIDEGSTLVLGREGLSARGSGATGIPMTYPIHANRIDLAGASSLVLMPNAYLSTGALLFSENSTINFNTSGVSRIWWGDGTFPGRFHMPEADCDIGQGHQGGPIGSEMFHYIVSEGLDLIINELPAASGYYREFVVVNQGANPLKDIALTLSALDALHDTVSTRLADELIDPVTTHVSAKGRKWVNETWIRYIHSETEYDVGDITTPGMDGRISNVVVGFDGLLPGRVILGLHVGMGDNSLDTTNDTNIRSKQKFIGVHGAQRFGKAHFAASAAIGKAGTDSFRNESGNNIRGKWDTSYYSATLEIGATLNPWQKLTLRPHASLRYASLKVGGYYERGLSPLIIEDFNDTSAQAIFGLNAGYKLSLFKRDVTLNFSLARKNAIKTPRGTLDTHYFDAPGTPITLKRGDYYSGIIAGGLSARVSLSRNTIVGLSFDYEQSSNYNRMTASALCGYMW